MAEGSPGDRLPANSLLGGRYRLESRIGSGGMGVVYRATDETLGRTVAVKLFRDSEAADLGRKSSETRLLAALNHPSLVTLYDARIDGDGDAYLVMEFVDGPTLRTRISDGPVAPVDAARMARDLGEALHVVHAAAVVHRDVKPANVLLRRSLTPGEEFTATLADFGIAHLVGSSRLTTPGTLLGTAAYLSPEQVRGSEPAPSSDIYSLGLVLLESLTGERVYAQSVVHEAALARLTQDPEIPGSLGYGWKSLLASMTARDPDARPTALEVVEASRGLRADQAGADAATAAMTASAVTAAMTVPEATVAITVPEETLAATRQMSAPDAPTVVLGTTSATSATTATSGPRPPRRPRRRAVLLAGIGAAAVLAAVLAWSLLMVPEPSSPPATPATTGAPIDPEDESTTVDAPPSTQPEPDIDPVEPTPLESTPVATEPATPEPSTTSEPVAPVDPGNNGNGNGNNGNGSGNGNGKNK